jgi:hypothetical protein
MDATSEMLDPDYAGHPLPADYVWVEWRSVEQTFEPVGDSSIYLVTYTLNVTAYDIVKGDYTMSYVGGTYNSLAETWYSDNDTEASWDNPITVNPYVAIKSVSVGEIKANYR